MIEFYSLVNVPFNVNDALLFHNEFHGRVLCLSESLGQIGCFPKSQFIIFMHLLGKEILIRSGQVRVWVWLFVFVDGSGVDGAGDPPIRLDHLNNNVYYG